MDWKIPVNSKNQVDKAGKKIKNSSSTEYEKKEATIVIDNWRASHAYPLHIIYCNLKRRNDKDGFIVAQRLKRLDSIINKLKREPTMSLWTMQDLGGCRLIVPNIDDVYKAIQDYKNSRIRHILIKEYDYIKSPKTSGYRSYHCVYQYQSDTHDIYNRNILIEIQVRTRLQHLWATALETMGLFTNQALKASHGEADTLRFFALISSLFAIEEGTETVPGTPNNRNKLIQSINDLESKNKYLDFLSAIRVGISDASDTSNPRNGYYILKLNYITSVLKLRFFKASQIEEATRYYNTIESDQEEKDIDAVLVSVASFATLKAAYPNYFLDIMDFVNTVSNLITSQN